MIPTDQPGRDRIFVGDVHGCADELDELLAALDYDPGLHELWFVGDLVNRGPHSLRTLRRVRELGADAVLGNHDLHAIACWNGIRKRKSRDTLGELFDAPDAAELMGWLRTRPALVTWDDLVLVHAGLHPEWNSPEAVAVRIRETADMAGDPFLQSDLAWATTARFCDSTGRLPRKSRKPGARYAPWDEYYDGERLVVFGHWAQRGLVQKRRVRGLDSGCVWGGRLTAWDSRNDRFVSVPAHRQYQPIDD